MGNGNWERKEKSEDWATHFRYIIGNPAYSYSNSQLGNLFASAECGPRRPLSHNKSTQIQNDSTQLRLHGPTTSYAYTLLGNSHPLHHALGVVHNIVDEGRERNATTRVLPAAPGQ